MNLCLPGQSRHRTVDIRDFDTVLAAVRDVAPQVIFHFAAQSLVRTSYRDPLATYATNVMGTLHVLLAARDVPGRGGGRRHDDRQGLRERLERRCLP